MSVKDERKHDVRALNESSGAQVSCQPTELFTVLPQKLTQASNSLLSPSLPPLWSVPFGGATGTTPHSAAVIRKQPVLLT